MIKKLSLATIVVLGLNAANIDKNDKLSISGSLETEAKWNLDHPAVENWDITSKVGLKYKMSDEITGVTKFKAEKDSNEDANVYIDNAYFEYTKNALKLKIGLAKFSSLLTDNSLYGFIVGYKASDAAKLGVVYSQTDVNYNNGTTKVYGVDLSGKASIISYEAEAVLTKQYDANGKAVKKSGGTLLGACVNVKPVDMASVTAAFGYLTPEEGDDQWLVNAYANLKVSNLSLTAGVAKTSDKGGYVALDDDAKIFGDSGLDDYFKTGNEYTSVYAKVGTKIDKLAPYAKATIITPKEGDNITTIKVGTKYNVDKATTIDAYYEYKKVSDTTNTLDLDITQKF